MLRAEYRLEERIRIRAEAANRAVGPVFVEAVVGAARSYRAADTR